MRPQQKSFVVEIKSKGRLSTARKGSIWGTTDLKALAQQAASVAPQLFDTTSALPKAEIEIPAQQKNGGSLADLMVPDRDDHARAADPVPVASKSEPALPEAVMEPAPTKVMTQQPTATATKKIPSEAYVTPLNAELAQEVDVTNGAINDDLALLEAENVRLKSLWSESLRQQNRRLRTMLERFASI